MPRKKRVVVDRESFLHGLEEIQTYTGLGPNKLRSLIARGQFPAWKEGRTWLSTKQACDDWAARRLKRERG
ncbi:MAG: helix-turn-helix domain-containing protein [Proteobacteria bacterium]|nr:helix-turn-helix domain-containing protein [Pseudomonadota bacterium]MBU1740791.1 helix-turn-helix domain-containing protein [Pseudomonadota bacterium]